MQNPNISDITRTLKEGLRESLCQDTIGLFHHLLLFLSKGNPFSISQIAATLQTSHDEINAALGKLRNVEVDQHGNIVGAGITLNPTRHHFQINDCNLFTWCAMDTLIFPAILHQTAHVVSTCPTTGITISLTVSSEGVENLEPAGVVVSLPKLSGSCCDVRTVFCDQVHFFSSSNAASNWLSEHPGATVLPVADAWRIGAELSVELTSFPR